MKKNIHAHRIGVSDLGRIGLALAVLAFSSAVGWVAEPATTRMILPPPKATVPALPADGSGSYRLELNGFNGTLLWLVLEVVQGKVARGVALPVHQSFRAPAATWGQVDTSSVTIAADRISGNIAVSFIPAWDVFVSLRGGDDPKKPNPKYRAYEMKPSPPIQVTLDVTVSGDQGSGTWSTGTDKALSKGEVRLRRESALPLPEAYELEFYMPAGRGDHPQAHPSLGYTIWLRARIAKEKQPITFGWFSRQRQGADPITWRETKITWAEERLKGRFTGEMPDGKGETFTLEVEGQRVGRNIFGGVTFRQGDYSITTPWVGLVDSVSWQVPVDGNIPPWTWQHDVQSDPKLVAAAIEESSHPVLPGEPDKTGFWTWRMLVPNPPVPRQINVIYPPSFDLEETVGAKSYRFTVKPGPRNGSKESFTFVADKPWRPLAPIWKELPPGLWQLTVVGLDDQGKELPGPMRMGLGKKPAYTGPAAYETPQDYQPPAREVVETGPIPFTKRASFAGPYSTAPARSWTKAALAAVAWDHSYPGSPERRGLQATRYGFIGGEYSFGCDMAPMLWAELAIRSLTDQPAQRLQAEQLIEMWMQATRLHQQQTQGMFYNYKGYTVLSHWPTEAMLDAWVQTGDPGWKERCLDYGRALVKLQNKNGTFLAYNRKYADIPQESLPGPDKLGYSSYSRTYVRNLSQTGTSELLYVLGRLRRDLNTDEFLEAERLAYRWMIEVAIPERYFPLYVQHSQSIHWPQRQHAMSALYFCRYLLECAPVEHRDVKLVEQVARWAEDYRVDWKRAGAGPQQTVVTPRIDGLDRFNNNPVAVNLLAAIVFQRLGQETRNPLWIAKGETLATAVLVAQDPKTGYLNVVLAPQIDSSYNRQFHDGLSGNNDFCRGWAAQLLREYAALKDSEKLAEKK